MNDKLREALEAAKPFEKLFADADRRGKLSRTNFDAQIATVDLRRLAYAVSDLREALAASKQELAKQSEMYRELVQSKLSSKQEPQAQAEPEVVAEILRLNGVLWDVTTKPGKWKSATDDDIRYTTEPLITLQSHREAMAKMQVEITNRGDWLVEWNKCKGEIQRLEAHRIAYREAIAKKDAALDVCLEALRYYQQQRKYLDVCGPAIIQAEKARK